MTHNFIEYNQDQQHLMPKDLSEWIEEDSLERYVSDTIDYLDSEGRLEPFYPEPRKDGRGVVCAKYGYSQRLLVS